MKKRYAIITDIHGNLEALNAILDDINNKNIDEIFCLGDILNIGPNCKECIDKLIDLNIKTTLGNHELYYLRGTDIEPTIDEEEKRHYKWVIDSLSDREKDFIKSCPMYYEIKIDYDEIIPEKKIILCHFLIKDEKLEQPYEANTLESSVDLWKKYYDPNITYIIGHVHHPVDCNKVEGISNDYIENLNELPNIEVVESAGCSFDEYVSYMILEIDKSIKYEHVKVKYDRESFINKLINIDFPDKKNVLKDYYGIDNY